MSWHIFSTSICDPPSTMVHYFISISLAYAPISMARAVGVRSTAIRVHGEEIMRDVLSRGDVNMTESDIPIEMLKMEERVQVVCTEVVTSPRSIGVGAEEIT